LLLSFQSEKLGGGKGENLCGCKAIPVLILCEVSRWQHRQTFERKEREKPDQRQEHSKKIDSGGIGNVREEAEGGGGVDPNLLARLKVRKVDPAPGTLEPTSW